MAEKKKVLCLHGYSMNAGWLTEWCEHIQTYLSDIELIIPDAPVQVPEDEVRCMAKRFNMAIPEWCIGEGKNWCWYRATEDKPPVYQQIETSFDMLEALFKEQGGFDGILGWSQGAVMAAILAALYLKNNDQRYKVNWLVVAGGFRPGDQRFRDYFDEPLNLPSLHVIGEKESSFMLEQGDRLASSFVAAQKLTTPVGHIFPLKHPKYMRKIAEWMNQQSGSV